MKMSSASLRAQKHEDKGYDWFCGFAYSPAYGLGPEEGVYRRDPSSIIKVGDYYYVYYTKSFGPHFGHSSKRDMGSKVFPWDHADIWCAKSTDGVHWEEIGAVVKRGTKGEYDERTVCTPDVMEYSGKYYLVYQACPMASYNGRMESVGMAVSSSPEGGFEKLKETLISPQEDGEIFGEEAENINKGMFNGVNHDPMLLHYNGKFYMYYKCCGKSFDEMASFGKDTRWGVAIADEITGPYIPSEYNPVTNSGHETLLWKYNGGIAALINRDGPEKETIQYAKDGINFEVMSQVTCTPQAGGAYRCEDTNSSPLAGLRWGLCHLDERGAQWNCIMRYDIDMRNPYAHAHGYPESNSRSLGRW